jgi:hypothetical protein
MPDPATNPDPDSQEAQMKLLETLVGDLPAFRPGEDTGQGVLAPEGQEAQAFYQSFNPPQQAAPRSDNGQPVSAAPSQPPPPLQPQQAPAPAAQPSTGSRLLAGQYRSVEELERGYQSSRTEAKRLYDENIALKAAQLAVEKIGGFRQPREEPKPQPVDIPVQFRGDQPVVPTEALIQQMEQRARQVAQETVSGILTPMQQLGSANASLRSTYPEFAQQEGQFASWLRDNPRYQGLIQNDPEVGLESAYLKFARDSGVQQTHVATQATHAAQQQIESARQQAAPAGNVSPSSRRPTETESKWGELKKLYDEAQLTGDYKRFNKARIEYALGDQFVNTLNNTNWGR